MENHVSEVYRRGVFVSKAFERLMLELGKEAWNDFDIIGEATYDLEKPYFCTVYNREFIAKSHWPNALEKKILEANKKIK